MPWKCVTVYNSMDTTNRTQSISYGHVFDLYIGNV